MSKVKLARLSPQGKIIADCIPSQAGPKRVVVFGHSEALAGVGMGVPTENRATARLAQALGATEVNYGVEDSVLAYDGFQAPRTPAGPGGKGWPSIFPVTLDSNPEPWSPEDRGGLAVMWWGICDALTTSSTPGFSQALRAAVARWRLHYVAGSGSAHRTAQTAWNTARTTAAGTGAAENAYKAASTVGASMTLNLASEATPYPQRVVYIGFVMTGGEATVAVTVNGGDTHSHTLSSFLGNMAPGVVRLEVPAGDIEIEVEVLAIDSGAEIGFNWFGIEAEVPPIVAIPEVHHTLSPLASSTLLGDGWPNAANFIATGKQIAAAYNTVIDVVCAEFGSRVVKLPVEGVVPDQASGRFLRAGDALLNEYAHAYLAGRWLQELLAGPMDSASEMVNRTALP